MASIKHALARGKFKFGRAKGVAIPKKNHAYRPIVISSVESRIVQRAILQIISDFPSIKEYTHNRFSFGGIRTEKIITRNNIAKSPGGVPRAIEETLQSIRNGAEYVWTADISSFFSNIRKNKVLDTLRAAIADYDLCQLVEEAVHVELANMDALGGKRDIFPTHDVGVAQGNCLSPLLGNIYLADFDQKINSTGCSCFRYIDDFIILGDSAKSVRNARKHAEKLLSDLGLEISSEKTSDEPRPVREGFEFLGIEIVPGLIRPSKKSRKRLRERIDAIIDDGSSALIAARQHGKIDRSQTLLATLRKLDVTLEGWAKHYVFCNDENVFKNIDIYVDEKIAEYIGLYTSTKKRFDAVPSRKLLGVTQVSHLPRKSFAYPRSSALSLGDESSADLPLASMPPETDD